MGDDGIREEEFAAEPEAVLYDALSVIFKNLNIRDLGQASIVSKSWFQAAKAELDKRSIQCLGVEAWDTEHYFADDEDCSSRIYKYSSHISYSLRIKPFHSFIFYDPKSPPYHSDVGKEIFSKYLFELPISYSVIEALGGCIGEEHFNTLNNEAVGIFVPKNSSIDVKVYAADYDDIMEYPVRNPNFPEEIVSRLMSVDCRNHCFIVFCFTFEDESDNSARVVFSRNVLTQIKKRFQPGKISLWGGCMRDIVTEGCGVKSDVSNCWIAMRLCGPSFMSWSISLDLALSTSEAEEKLRTFKAGIEFKRKSLALALVPASSDESNETKFVRTEAFRKIFPEVTLTCIYNDSCLPLFSIDSSECDPRIVPEVKDKVIYLITTHS